MLSYIVTGVAIGVVIGVVIGIGTKRHDSTAPEELFDVRILASLGHAY